jgi:A/G-specific adenine glycosylase
VKPDIRQFQGVAWQHYKTHGRDLPWRQTSINAYQVLVSEVMLQQTQVSRVVPKYQEFLKRFPSINDLAVASLSEVLKAWSGMGYNRRAKYLWQAAQSLANKPEPWSLDDLVAQLGIGPNTAAAVLVYAYNQPAVFIETNIRSVFIHHFFAGKQGVHDKELLPLIQASLDMSNPREWYWALMDYGSHLKATHGNAAARSYHYQRQSTFAGSRRQLRGQIIRLLTSRPYKPQQLLSAAEDARASDVIDMLAREGLIVKSHGTYKLA